MVSTFTTARNLEKPAAGDQVGTWGTASINPDLDVIDAGMGQTTTISAAGGSVVLSGTQFRCAEIVINSTLLASITLTFPTSFTGPYTIFHNATGSSAFIITLTTTAASAQAICAPPGELVDVFNDGTSLRYKNLGRIGSILDTMLSSMPNWVDGCAVKPYLNCDGSAVSSATHPVLVSQGITILPDLRGRYRATLNQGTGRITSGSSTGGVDGDTRSASGGSQTTTLSSQNMPPVLITDPGHTHPVTITPLVQNENVDGTDIPGGTGASLGSHTYTSCSATTGITAGNSSPTNFSNLPPTAMGGITMIRAA